MQKDKQNAIDFQYSQIMINDLNHLKHKNNLYNVYYETNSNGKLMNQWKVKEVYSQGTDYFSVFISMDNLIEINHHQLYYQDAFLKFGSYMGVILGIWNIAKLMLRFKYKNR